MANIYTLNTNVYKCDTCNRSVRVPINNQGIEIVQRCIVTEKCLGKMNRVINPNDINNTPTFPPEVTGLVDWAARNVLFNFTQTIASTTWNIQHDLENNPDVFLYINQIVNGVVTLVEIESSAVKATIKIIDLNNIQIIFEQAQSGIVQCVALSSQNNTTPSTLAVTNVGTSNIVLSNHGELTFATLDSSQYVNITIMFNSSSSPQPIVIEYLNVSTTPNITSPWAGINYVIVNGVRYYVRSINLLTTQPGPIIFQTGIIANASTAYFPNTTTTGQLLILLANSPQTTADRIYNQYMDTASDITSTPLVYYSTGDLYASSSLIKNTYPPITTG